MPYNSLIEHISLVCAMHSHSNGVFLAALSSLFFSLCSLIAKFLEELSPIQLSCFSFLGILIISLLPAVVEKENLFPKGYRKLLACRSVVGTIFLLCSFKSVQLIPLGDASVLFYLAPAFTVVLAKWILKEPCSPVHIVIAAMLLACVVLVMKPSFVFSDRELTLDYIAGVILAIVASMCDALGNVILRDLRLVHFSVILFNYGLMSFIQTSVLSFFFSKWTSVNYHQVILLIILIVFNMCEQVLMTLALSVEHAGPVAMIQASDIVYGYAFQVTFFNESVDTFSIFGGAIIASLLIYSSMLNKRRKTVDSVLV